MVVFLLKKGGIFVYSICIIDWDENGDVVVVFLVDYVDF